MSNTVIRVENLGKKYIIDHQQKRRSYKALRDIIADQVRSLGQMFGRNGKEEDSTHEEFWALKDVSFEIKQGERVGIIGRNGAGKSTLLKILSRITEPTTGKINIKGRIASLLEVGTGFHPELTGRENIYLNGAILGMSRTEIKSKFDEIVNFAEVEKFLDTPVKRYSSGMYVRLAFAVAAHLEPEILIVDEVLSVGDAQFQKKCLGKMEDVAEEGKTVLFVSHNLGVIQSLCNRGILLSKGNLSIDANINLCTKTYLSQLEKNAKESLSNRKHRRGAGAVRIVSIDITDESGNSTLSTGSPAIFTFHLTNLIPNLSCIFAIYDYSGTRVAVFDSSVYSSRDLEASDASDKIVCKIEELPLVTGRYSLNVAIVQNFEEQDYLESGAIFDVESVSLRGRAINQMSASGIVCIPHFWVHPQIN